MTETSSYSRIKKFIEARKMLAHKSDEISDIHLGHGEKATLFESDISLLLAAVDEALSESQEKLQMTDKFVSPAPLPTPYERELLTILMEECAEIQQRASKILRFGASEIQPEQGLTNVERMSLEIGDFEHIVYTLTELGLVCPTHVFQGIRNKKDQLAKYLQHDKEATDGRGR